MRVTCPDCHTRYDLPAAFADALAAADRRLRCAQCGHVWLQQRSGTPDAAPAATPAATLAATLAVDDPGPREPFAATPHEIETLLDAGPAPRTAPAAIAGETLHAPLAADRPLPAGPAPLAPPTGERPPASPLVWGGWAASVAVVVAVLALAWTHRAAVMRAVPATTPLYAALGGAPARPAH